jgi:hypothetical protein
MQEVAKLFAGIFLTIIPVIAMLKAGVDGPFGAMVRAVTNADGTPNPAMYFWATGCCPPSWTTRRPIWCSSIPPVATRGLMTDDGADAGRHFCGAVFMGANTYIGNAPNLMVKAIAEDRGVKMPSFFGYMAWSVGILVPLLVLMTFIWFRCNAQQTCKTPHPDRPCHFPEVVRGCSSTLRCSPTRTMWSGPAELAALQGKDGVLTTGSRRIDAALLAACPQLKIVANMAVGYNNFDVPR